MKKISTQKIHLAILPMLALTLACTAPTIERINLDDYESKVFSQHGEDGVIEQIFEIIKPTNKYAVEFGAYDGVTISNTRKLILDGWASFQIEGHPYRAKLLAKEYEDNPKVTTLEAWIFPGNIEILFEEAGVPKDLDFLVIDIDSNDYYVWRAIQSFRPKVVMIESNASFPPPELAVIDFHPFNYWDLTNYVGASLQSMYNLAKTKDYELIHVMRTGPNIFFVDKQYYDLFGIEDNSPVKMARPLVRVLGDEKSYPEEKKTLKVDAFEIEKKWIER
ncbi:MAG TPA: hypothetical protein EYG16_01780 [Deltaproteobacteria bacterium]|nr:hypothetical protein [Candidatus Binatota bacterium]HIL12383.1 hypothetical protein [Deltaproteobacteria bacterium]